MPANESSLGVCFKKIKKKVTVNYASAKIQAGIF